MSDIAILQQDLMRPLLEDEFFKADAGTKVTTGCCLQKLTSVALKEKNPRKTRICECSFKDLSCTQHLFRKYK
jgi:hypothetical protein